MCVRLASTLLIIFAFCCTQVQSQDRCATTQYMQYLYKKKGIPEHTKQFEDWLQKKIAQRKKNTNLRIQAASYQIPVVVHVIHNGENINVGSNISDARIFSQIDVLNNDYKRLNADTTNTPPEFKSVAGNLDIEFVLARQTPDGQPTTGIVRMQGTKTSWAPPPGTPPSPPGSDDTILKSLSYWPSEDYLNIWVTNLSSNNLGYAQFPVSNLQGLEPFLGGLEATDGVVIDYTVFGVGSEEPDYDLGRTVTHEVGHFFGLRHIWGDVNNCNGTDYVADTPQQERPTLTCAMHPQAECSGNKMFQNFMDYTDDACMNLFTQGQIDRMSVILDDPDVPRRSSLLTSHGLDIPECGSNPLVDVAITRIVQPGPVTCNANPDFIISVKNVSTTIVNSLKIEFNVNNGTTQTTTVTDLSIENNCLETLVNCRSLNLLDGENIVAVRIASINNDLPDSNPNNSDTIITIILNTSADIIPLRKTFDDNQINSWTVANPQSGILWNLEEINNQFTARFPSLTGSLGEESWLVSPVLDFSQTTQASMFFNLSYSWAGENDRLRILASTNCGDLYIEPDPNFDLNGFNLNSNNVKKYLNLNSLAGYTDVRIAFVGTNALGNNIYVDNIEFFVSDNPTPIDPAEKPYTIYWNDTGGVDITFNLPERKQVGMVVTDIMGREVLRGLLPDILNQTIPVLTGNVGRGVYIIRLQIGKKYYATKVYLAP